jgi:hypothetical protein
MSSPLHQHIVEVPPQELQPGDVLLYRRHSLLGRLIRAFDSRDVSHAALFLGSDDDVAEAIGEGLLRRPLATSLGDDRRDYILAYRWNGEIRPSDLIPVTKHAEAYLAAGVRYAHAEVMLAAFLALTRKFPLTVNGRFLVRAILDRAALRLLTLPEVVRPSALMCSEFVYRCYLDTPRPLASLQIPGFSAGSSAGGFESDNPGDAPSPPSFASGSVLDRAAGIWDEEGFEGDQPIPSPGLPIPVLDGELEVALAAFERELDDPFESVGAGEPELGGAPGDDDLLRAMRRFAAALNPRRDSPYEDVDGGDRHATVPSLQRFRQLVPNFVTPGDLATSTSLRLLGRVARSASAG